MAFAQLVTSVIVISALSVGMALGLKQPDPKRAVASIDGSVSNEVYIVLDMIAVPHISQNLVQGYLITKFTLKLTADVYAGLGVAANARINDVINRIMIEKLGVLRQTKSYEINEVVSSSLVTAINEEFNAGVATGIFVNQLDYLEKDAVRTPRESDES